MSTTDPNSPTDPPANPTPRAEGATLAGCYALSRKLEVATSTEVWLAHDEVLGKDVSLHFAPDEIRKDARAVQELRLDIKRNRQLIHPNILRVYDLVEEPDWLAVSMDAFEGESIAGLLERVAGKGAVQAEIQPWVNQLAQTLEEAHKINVLHRDLTPSSIFLTPAGKLLVANFGISRTIRDAQTRAGTGETSGLAYGSPQLLDGKPAARTDDVYSLGAILFAVLTGKPPFEGGDLPQQVRAGISAEKMALLQNPDLKVPASWKTTIAACLDKSPEMRPATAADVARRLAAPAEEPLPVAAAPAAPAAAKAEPSVATVAAAAAAPAAMAAASILRVPGTKPPAAGSSDEKVMPASEEPKAEPKTLEAKISEPKKAPEPTTPELKIAPVTAEPKSAPSVADSKTAPAPVEAKSIPAPLEVKTAPASPAVADAPASPAVADAPAAPAVGEAKKAPVTLESKIAPASPEPKIAPVPAAPVEAKSSPVSDGPKPKTAPLELKPGPAAPEPKSAPGAVELKPASITEPSKSAAGPATPQKGLETASKDARKEIEPKRTAPVPPVKTPDTAPRLYPEDSRFPMMGLAAAAVVIVVIALIYHFSTSGKPSETAGEAPPEKGELRPLSTPPVDSASPSSTGPVVQTTPTSTPAVVPAATPGPGAVAASDSHTALEKARLEAQAADKALADLVKQREVTQADVAGAQKSLDEKVAASKGLKKAIEEVAARRKKLEDEKKAAETAAAEAQKAAAEKARLAEESAKALAELDKTSAEKMTAPQQAEAEIASLQKTLGEKQHALDDGAKVLALAEAAKQQKLAAVTDREREIERLKSADEEAMKQREAEAVEKSRLDSELAELKRKMDEIENRQKQFKNPSGATPPPKPAQTPAAVSTPRLATPAPALSTPKVNTPPPAPATPLPATPAPATPRPLALLTTPAPVIPATPAPSTTVAGGNSLGMKFVPVGDVEFCIWQTRIRDFEAFAKSVNLKSGSWKNPGFKQAPEHPVVNVSWQEAIAFCKWLTDKEHKDNTLPASLFYRLPTDLEWSKAVGLPEEPGRTPELRDMQIPDVYPWGTQWPPPAGVGNYTGEETGSDVAIKGYEDGFAWTSPVGSFPPNKFGIYDMGGNVWQWCMDAWNADSKQKVLRGASWYNGALKLSLLSSCRIHAAADSSTDNYGFRIVRAKEDGKAGKK